MVIEPVGKRRLCINNIFYLDTPKKIIKVEDTIQSYKKFYITTDYDEVKQFIKKFIPLPSKKGEDLYKLTIDKMAEIEARKIQYEYYRNTLLQFKEKI